MLTYDGISKPPGLGELFDGKGMPDVIECGENNEVWFHVCRSKRELRITNKVDGKVKTVEVGVCSAQAFARIALAHGFGPRQRGVAWALLKPPLYCREGCGHIVDTRGGICPGCDAYREHTGAL